jgi:uridine phosphorylase
LFKPTPARLAGRRTYIRLVPHHLRPSTPYAADVLLPGDPGRALMLAQELLTEPKMSNHARGLWGYSGETPGGRPLSIQSTGMGGPSAAIVLRELAELGVRRAIRVGTCGALDAGLGHGDLVVVGCSIAEDGASRAMGAEDSAEPDPELTAALARSLPAGSEPAVIVSTDLFYDGEYLEDETTRADRWRGRGAVAVEMEAATLFTLGRRIGVAVACVLAVTDTFTGGQRQRMDDEAMVEAAREMGTAAATALADSQP